MDPLTLVLGTAAVVVPAYFGLRATARPKFDFQLVYGQPLGGADVKLPDFVQPVTVGPYGPPEPHVSVLRFTNSGRATLTPEAFATDVEVDYGGAFLISASAGRSSSPGLNPDYIIDGDDPRLLISPLLLNARDWFEIQMFTNGDVDKVQVTGRIAGVRRIRERRAPLWRAPSLAVAVGAPVVGVFAVVWCSYLVALISDRPVAGDSIVVGALSMAGAGLGALVAKWHQSHVFRSPLGEFVRRWR